MTAKCWPHFYTRAYPLGQVACIYIDAQLMFSEGVLCGKHLKVSLIFRPLTVRGHFDEFGVELAEHLD